jgi:hypothetical protein
MGSEAPSIRANIRTLHNGPFRKSVPAGSRLRVHRRWRHQPFAAFATATSRLVAKAGANLKAVSSTTLRHVSRRQYAKLIAQLAVFSYILGATLDWDVNFLLVLIASGGIASAFLSFGEGARLHRSPIVYLVGLFLLAAGLSVLISDDEARSLQLSAPLIPAVLLFFLIYEYFDDARDLRHLYACLTIVALGLAVVLL